MDRFDIDLGTDPDYGSRSFVGAFLYAVLEFLRSV